jgi:thioredoxin-like negative regulator of GroEL
MTDHPALAVALGDAGAALDHSPLGDLPPASRLLVYRALGDPDDVPGDGGPGHRRRTRLALAAARRVAHLWSPVPDCPEPDQLLQAGEEMLAALRLDVGVDAAQSRAEELLADWDVVAGELAGEAGEHVYGAAAAALTVALADEPLVTGDVDVWSDAEHQFVDEIGPDTTDEDISADTRDAAVHSATAVADGTTSDDVDRRRAFWRWWLAEAVPSAATAEEVGRADTDRLLAGRIARHAREEVTDDRAVADYHRVLAGSPDDPDARYGMGLVRFRAGQPGAVGLLRGVTGSHPLAVRARHLADLVELFDIGATDPTDPAAARLVAEAAGHTRAGRHPQAMEVLLRLVEQHRSFGDDLGRRALVALFGYLGQQEPEVRQFQRRLGSLLY